MSRSIKRSSISDYSRKGTKKNKRLASKSVRRYNLYISNGRSFKKLFNSWNIFDFKQLFFKDSPEEFEKFKRK